MSTHVAGSFRDPAGHVHLLGGRVLRTVTDLGLPDFAAVRDTGFLDDLVADDSLVPFHPVTDAFDDPALAAAPLVLEHPRLPFLSHPYEWSFPLMQAAALFHLRLQIRALERGIVLSDASAYNVQFVGPRPVFIDHLSFRPYAEGEYWLAHRQFCEQFLNPLLLRSVFDIPHNDWMRGSFDGIPSEHVAQILPLHRRLSLRMLTHVVAPVALERRSRGRQRADGAPAPNRRPLPRSAYLGMLRQLEGWISGLTPRRTARTTWESYARTNTYAAPEVQAKRAFVESFVQATQPGTLIDLGCNSGDYSELALQAGARNVIGFDIDQRALELAHARAVDRKLPFLPLHFDASNPSPNLGWRQTERAGFVERVKGDAVLALAFLHHLCIAKNIPIRSALEWIVGMAPRGVVEFVPKTDTTVGVMLELRKDVFPFYTQAAFEAELGRLARIVRSDTITAEGRVLYWYERD